MRTFVILHAIEQTQLWRQHRDDGVGRLKLDVHTGAAYWRGGGSSADEVFDCAVVLAWFALAALAVMAWQDKVKGDD